LINDPDFLELKYSLKDRAIRRYLDQLGFYSRVILKGTFEDGHEREDVVAHRTSFLRDISEFNFSTFGDDTGYSAAASECEEKMLETRPVVPEGESHHVAVCHDESTIYCNEGVKRVILEKQEQILRAKGEGASLMCSDFICACHGPLYWEEAG